MDGIVFKVRQSVKVINKTIYLAVGLNREGYNELLGMWLGQNESASFWQDVLTDLKARGVEDTTNLIENLNGKYENIPKTKWHSQQMMHLKNRFIYH